MKPIPFLNVPGVIKIVPQLQQSEPLLLPEEELPEYRQNVANTQNILIPDLSGPIAEVNKAIADTRENIPNFSQLDAANNPQESGFTSPGFDTKFIPDISAQFDPEVQRSQEPSFEANLIPDTSAQFDPEVQRSQESSFEANLIPDTSAQIDPEGLTMTGTNPELIPDTSVAIDPEMQSSEDPETQNIGESLVPDFTSEIEFPEGDNLIPLSSPDEVNSTAVPDFDSLEEVRSSSFDPNTDVSFIGQGSDNSSPLGSLVKPIDSSNLIPTLDELKQGLANIYSDDDDGDYDDVNFYDYDAPTPLRPAFSTNLNKIPVVTLPPPPQPTLQNSNIMNDKSLFHKIPILSNNPTPSFAGGIVSNIDGAEDIFNSGMFQTSFQDPFAQNIQLNAAENSRELEKSIMDFGKLEMKQKTEQQEHDMFQTNFVNRMNRQKGKL